jgi:hypothetical protein
LRFVEDRALFTREGTGGGTSGQRHRVGRRRVHPPRQPRRGPGPAHPCRGGQQGADPGRPVVVDRRSSAARCESRGLGDVQHVAGISPHRQPRGAVRRTARAGQVEAAGPGDRRSGSPPDPPLVGPASGHRRPPRRGGSGPRTGWWQLWRNTAPPGSTGTCGPRRNASHGVPRSTQPTPPTSQRPSWTRRSPAPSDSPAAACRYPCGQATTHNGIGDLRDCAVTIAERGTAFFAHPRLNAIAASMPSWSDRLPFLEAPATEA